MAEVESPLPAESVSLVRVTTPVVEVLVVMVEHVLPAPVFEFVAPAAPAPGHDLHSTDPCGQVRCSSACRVLRCAGPCGRLHCSRARRDLLIVGLIQCSYSSPLSFRGVGGAHALLGS